MVTFRDRYANDIELAQTVGLGLIRHGWPDGQDRRHAAEDAHRRTLRGARLRRNVAPVAVPRFAVQAGTEQECAEGLRRLLSLGLQPAMLPRLLTDNRWMARAVPATAKTPAEDGRGPGSG